MHALRLSAICLGASCAACAMPRSMVLGQTAGALGTGQAEAAASVGPQFTQFTDNGSAGTSSASNPSLFSFPVTEANFQYGVGDSASINVHLSPAGLQPGVKVTLLNGPIKLAILPEVGGGLLYEGSGSGSETDFVFIAGAKVIVSGEAGWYAGVGYDFTYLSGNLNATAIITGTSSGSGSTTNEGFNATSHSASGAIGYEFRAGLLRIRPELAVLYSPGFQVDNVTGDGHVIFLPNVTVAVGTSSGSASGSDRNDSYRDRPTPASPFKF
jgi:hypothetical protein